MTMHKLYLDPFMDMCNGEIVSYRIDKHPSAKNVLDALEQVIAITSDCKYRRTFHSDQGWAYQMKAYSQRLKDERISKVCLVRETVMINPLWRTSLDCINKKFIMVLFTIVMVS